VSAGSARSEGTTYDAPTTLRPALLLVREELGTRDVILDGEVVALDEHGRQDFRALMAGRGNLHYAVFDVLWLKGEDLRECSLSRRKRILSGLVKKTSTVLSPVFCVRGRGPRPIRCRRAARSGGHRGEAAR